jgi:hypothetical protein
MKAIILPVCVLGLLTVAVADDLRTQLGSMGDAVQKAMMNRDIAAFNMALKGRVTPDFKYYETASAKPMTYDQMIAGMKMGFASMSSVKMAEMKVLSVKPDKVDMADSATVVTSHHMSAITTDAKKKSHVMTFSGTSIDTYKKVGGNWLMSSMTWKLQETKLDGHRMKPGQM